MPRNGSGVYSLPGGSTITNGDTSDASDINTPLADLVSDANAARPIVAGGTGATSASAARTALGLAIGTDVQAEDAGLTSIAGLTTAADKMIYTTALDTYAVADLTAAGRALLDDADAAAQLATLGAAPTASPTFTGIPAAPTATLGTNTTQVATTAFVEAAVGASVGSDWEFVETIATTSGTSITVPSSGNLADGYQYAIEFLEVEHSAGVNNRLAIDMYGETDAAYTGSSQTISSQETTSGWYGFVQLPTTSRVALNAHSMHPTSMDGSASTPATTFSRGATPLYAPVFHFSTAQKIGRAKIICDAAASFDNGSVKLWRKAL